MAPFAIHRALGSSAFILLTLLFVAHLSKGQCPEKSFLEKRVAYKDAEGYSSETFLSELLNYLDRVQYCSYKNDSIHVRLAKRIAKVYYLNGDFLKAIKYEREAIRIITVNEKSPSVNAADLTAAYFWLSMFYESLNMTSEKMEALDSCYQVAIRTRHIDATCLWALYSRGQYYFDLGDYHRCIEYMQRCESLAKTYANLLPRGVAEQYISSSVLWEVKALLELNDYEKAERLLTNRIEECTNSGQINNFGTIFSQFGELEMRKGNYNEALKYYDKSVTNDQKIGHYFTCKQTLKDIGYNVYFSHFHDLEKALDYYKKALRFLNKDESLKDADKFESLSVYGNIANVYVRKGDYDLAFTYFQLAFDQIKPAADEDYILRIPQQEFVKYKKIHYLTSMQIDKADAFQSFYKSNRQKDALKKSILIYKKTDQLLDRIKMEQTDFDSKLFWRSDSRRLYEHAIEACFLLGDIDNALYFFEKSRAVLLQDQLIEQRWLGEPEIMKQTQLNKEMARIDKELSNADPSSKRYAELRDTLFSRKQQLEGARERIRISNPLYYQSFVNKDSITIPDIKRKILSDHQALVEIFAGDSAVYVLIITKLKSYLQKINKTKFDNLSTTYVYYLSHPDLLNRELTTYADVSNQLYEAIFQNIALPDGRIIISPDGRYFPFETLIANKTAGTYFVENFAVSYTYSARYLLNDFELKSNRNSRTFFGVAPVNFPNGLPSLSGTDQSLQRMHSYFRTGTSLVGPVATKSNFLKEYYQYRIVQLYTHATDSGASGEPDIYFADSTLSLSDLFYENRPASSLIVLSACETAEGKLYNGEGVFSFNRQFAALGIPSCVSTLWQADNQSTCRITELFYKYLAKGLPLDVALQSAKKEFIQSSGREKRLPYYWGASVLVGESGTIQLAKPFPWKWVTIGVIILVLLTLWGFKANKIMTNQRNHKH